MTRKIIISLSFLFVLSSAFAQKPMGLVSIPAPEKAHSPSCFSDDAPLYLVGGTRLSFFGEKDYTLGMIQPTIGARTQAGPFDVGLYMGYRFDGVRFSSGMTDQVNRQRGFVFNPNFEVNPCTRIGEEERDLNFRFRFNFNVESLTTYGGEPGKLKYYSDHLNYTASIEPVLRYQKDDWALVGGFQLLNFGFYGVKGKVSKEYNYTNSYSLGASSGVRIEFQKKLNF